MILALLFFFSDPNVEEMEDLLKKFVDVFNVVNSQAADPVASQQAIYQGAIPGMLRKLDPHSVFFDPQQWEQLKTMERSESKGFGSVVSVLPGRVTVLQATPGTPSAKSGLSPGDEILAINNIALNRLDFEQLVEFLGEAHQHRAELVVRRPGNGRLLTFVLDPALVDTPSVDRAFFLKPGVGYIRVASFDPQTGRQLKAAIDKLGGDKLAGLVLDLRNNPGGVVQAAFECASYFLKPGQRILSARGRHFKDEDVDVPKLATPYSFPVSIVVNEKTASAAEILTGALQDHDRAAVVGVPTYGKGLVQTVLPLIGNTGLALTTAFYYTPSGRSIQKPLNSGQLSFDSAKKEFHTDSGRVVLGGGGITPDRIEPPAPQNRLRVALETSGSFTGFGTEFIRKQKVEEGFVLTPEVLDEFHLYAAERGIQPAVSEWLQDSEWIRDRLQQEIVTLALGVVKGDEIEARFDVQVKAAVDGLKR